MTQHLGAALTPEIACEELRRVGLACAPEEVEIVVREERSAALLPGGRIAWFPASAAGARRLAVERRVLALIAARCSFAVPRPIAASDDGAFDVRQKVAGCCDPWDLFRRCREDPGLAQRIGRSLGAMLAEQHTRMGAGDVARWLPEQVAWPEPGDWIRARLVDAVDDPVLVRRMEAALARYEAVAVEEADRVLVHGDIGFHNLAVDPQSWAVNGVFDYDSAAFADRHHDFRYLLFDVGREDMLDAALAVYESATGRSLRRARIGLYNTVCAISYVAFRAGLPPDEKSCGRTLQEDLRWVRAALARLGL